MRRAPFLAMIFVMANGFLGLGAVLLARFLVLKTAGAQ